jgi:hypothetical protein
MHVDQCSLCIEGGGLRDLTATSSYQGHLISQLEKYFALCIEEVQSAPF